MTSAGPVSTLALLYLVLLVPTAQKSITYLAVTSVVAWTVALQHSMVYSVVHTVALYIIVLAMLWHIYSVALK